MRGSSRRANRRALALATLAGTLALAPAFGQQSPQSILPPGFGEPAPPPPPAAPAIAAPPPAQPAPDGGPPIVAPPPTPEDLAAAATAQADARAQAEAAAETLRRQDIPEFARAPVDRIGILPTEASGIAADGFGAEPGRYLATLMQRLDAPIASRWLSMLLRRTLSTEIDTPAGIDPADWTAARAALLVRMGEADAARLLVQRVDSDRATPALRAAILDAAMASADPSALCPVAEAGEAANRAAAWTLARAMCAGLSGESGSASALVDRARAAPKPPQGLDLLLAERVIGAGNDSRRAVNIQWSRVDRLDPWRFGLASAVGLAIPPSLLDGGGLAMQAWRARAPMLPLAGRVAALRTAATLGTVSSGDLVDAVSAVAEEGDPLAMDQTLAGRLRTAYAAADAGDRLSALRSLWADPADERDLYAAHILTARAAERVAPSADLKSDAAQLIQAMLSAGLDIQAARWAGVAAGLRGTAGDEAWAQLAVGAPRAMMTIDADRVADFGEGGRGAARLRARFLLAGLAGLGRLQPRAVDDLAGRLGVPLAAQNPWSRAIAGAAQRGEPATVVLLAAVGMQTSDWTQVDPSFLYHIVAGLHAVGLDPEARMIAAEAIART
ncbi:hypothetical protein [Sphingomonas sp.]|uniref:hypothetical protein n=1 Tax=Sphingomonas sp. TaxID=28214 RepID=UPI003AFF8E58